MCIPFKLWSAPKLFNILADLLLWIVEAKGVSPILHYLDDFLIFTPPPPACAYTILILLKKYAHSSAYH